jgi:polysaccharide export outer membrane protein
MVILKIRRSFLVIMLGLIISFSGCAARHETVEPPIPRDQSRASLDAQNTEQKSILGVGDEIKVIVWRRDDLNRALRIGPSGKIFFPLVGEVQASGRTPDEVRAEITDGLVKHVVNPQVNVEVATYRNRRFYVLGEVRKPGVFVIEDSVKAVEGLAMAGWFTHDANPKNVILVRQIPDYLELRSLNIEALLQEGDTEQNVYLQRGDVVYVIPSTIVDIERFMRRLYVIIAPLVEIQRGIIFGYEISDLIEGKSTRIILPVGTGGGVPAQAP